jgi:hypothetical protein
MYVHVLPPLHVEGAECLAGYAGVLLAVCLVAWWHRSRVGVSLNDLCWCPSVARQLSGIAGFVCVVVTLRLRAVSRVTKLCTFIARSFVLLSESFETGTR